MYEILFLGEKLKIFRAGGNSEVRCNRSIKRSHPILIIMSSAQNCEISHKTSGNILQNVYNCGPSGLHSMTI